MSKFATEFSSLSTALSTRRSTAPTSARLPEISSGDARSTARARTLPDPLTVAAAFAARSTSRPVITTVLPRAA